MSHSSTRSIQQHKKAPNPTSHRLHKPPCKSWSLKVAAEMSRLPKSEGSFSKSCSLSVQLWNQSIKNKLELLTFRPLSWRWTSAEHFKPFASLEQGVTRQCSHSSITLIHSIESFGCGSRCKCSLLCYTRFYPGFARPLC